MDISHPLRLTASTISFVLTGIVFTSVAGAQGIPNFNPLGPPPFPPGNPITVEKTQLGKVLFWDEQLSSTRTVACGTCHMPVAGGVDPRTTTDPRSSTNPGPDNTFGTGDDIRSSAGVPANLGQSGGIWSILFGMQPQVTPRRAPTVVNTAYSPEQFWDGRAQPRFRDPLTNAVILASGASLESLVAEPFVNPVEMGHDGRDWNDVVQRVEAVTPLALSPSIPAALDAWVAGRTYQQLFDDAFGTPEVTSSRICMAVATYMRTLVSDQTPMDQFIAGDTGALNTRQLRGFEVFVEAGCVICHEPPLMASPAGAPPSFFYTGVRPRNEDIGRAEVTGVSFDRGRMKTPGMRNLHLTAPYFHNGGKNTLEDVIDFYEAGGDFENGTNDIPPALIGSVQDRQDLITFLQEGLADARVEQALPPFDHPALSAATNRVPATFGEGTPGSSGVAPRIHALSPSLLGSTDFTVSLDGAPGGVYAALLLGFDRDNAGTPFNGARFFVSRTSGVGRMFRIQALNTTAFGEGWASKTISLPAGTSFAGTSMYAQWFVVDPHAGGALSATEAIEIVLFD